MIQYLHRPGRPTLAFCVQQGREEGGQMPMVLFLPGFRSDMEGTKALFLERQCAARGQGFVRFDYSGHGKSEGRFEDGTISSWTQDAFDILEHCCSMGRVVLAGSSMGGWIALLLARRAKSKVAGLVGIAAAPDFTLEIERELERTGRAEEMERVGFIDVPNTYSAEPYRITRALITDGRNNIVLSGRLDISVPVRLLQGKRDEEVDWRHALKIRDALPKDADVEVTVIEDGDHRLSRPQDLDAIDAAVRAVCGLQ